jgi:putative membrane protein
MSLNQTEARTINTKLVDIEAHTGVRITTAIVARCDAYVELPWKAFALGASLAAFVTVLAIMLAADGVPQGIVLGQAIAILSVGAASSLAALWLPPWARLFLRPSRRDVEVRQHAQAMFLTRELFHTPQRTGLLMLVSRFERKIQFLADSGLTDRVNAAEWHAVIERMTPSMRQGHAYQALLEGLAAVEALLQRKGFVSVTAPDGEAAK